jgi:hypothetical protein
MAIPKGQIPANVLKQNTVGGYLKFLSDEIRRVDDHWDHFGKAAAAAYADAYDHNGAVLKAVEDIQLARKAADEASMSFVLSLLTVGVAGAVAGGLVSASAKGAARVATQTAARDVVKQAAKQVIAPASNAALEALSPEVASRTVFAPADVTPTLYMAKLLEGISYNKGLLDDILHEVNYNPDAGEVVVPERGQVPLNRSGDGEITIDSAKFLAEVITGTSYFQQMPPMSVDSNKLTPKARLAMWIGWALNRDAKYWAKAEQTENDFPSKVTEEQLDWEPVRQDLLALWVPGGLITARTPKTYFLGGPSATLHTGLYMWGFMSWAASKSALDLLLDDTVRTKDPMVLQMVYARQARKTLSAKDANPARWIELPEPTVTPIN